MTSVTISISILQTFCSWVAASNLRPFMVFYLTTHPIRHCSSYECFILRAKRLSNQLLDRYMSRNVWNRLLESSMVGTRIWLNNMMSQSPKCYITFWWMHSIDQTLLHVQFVPLLLNWTLLPISTFCPIAWFPQRFATGVACLQRTLTPLDTWSCPTLGLACVLMLRPISPKLDFFSGLWSFEHP